MTERNSDLSRFFGRIVSQYDEHSKRIGEILDSAQGKFRQDFTLACAGTGAVALLGSISIALIGKSTTVAVIGASAGTVLLVAAMIFRAKSSEAQVKSAHMLVELERERAKFAQQSAMYTEIWLYGPPQGMDIGDAIRLIASSQQVDERVDGIPSTGRLLAGSSDKTWEVED